MEHTSSVGEAYVPLLVRIFPGYSGGGNTLAQRVSITAFFLLVDSECTHLCGD